MGRQNSRLGPNVPSATDYEVRIMRGTPMRNQLRNGRGFILSAAVIGSMLFCIAPSVQAQNPAIQQKLADISQSSAANKQALARYTWNEQQTISLKGDVKKVQQFQVRMGVDGQQQKVEINPQAPPPPSGGRFKQRIVEKKTDEFTDYGQQIAALGKQYAQPDMQALQQAYQQGNITMQANGAQGTVSLMVKSYLKPNDLVTLTFSQEPKALLSIQVNTYLTDPKDAVTVAVQFAKLPDGTNHVATIQVNGVSKQLGVAIQNSAYVPVQ
jgi:hypothetical protein